MTDAEGLQGSEANPVEPIEARLGSEPQVPVAPGTAAPGPAERAVVLVGRGHTGRGERGRGGGRRAGYA